MFKYFVWSVLIYYTVLFLSGTVAEAQKKSGGQKIYINIASVNRLKKAQGITEDIAKAIVKYMEEHGPFRDSTDLLQVPGITEDNFTQINPQINPEGFIYCVPILIGSKSG
jgi:competence ComEA-like helix-hairpin-helix protein